MTTSTQISHIQLQYSHTIGRGEQFGPGFTYPIQMARGESDTMYVLCRSPEYRPEGTRIVVCTANEEYINVFARGVSNQGPHEYNFEDGSLVWPTSVAIDSQGNVYVADEWLNRISVFNKDGGYLSKWDIKEGAGDGEINRPSGMAFDKEDNLFMVDSLNNRVQKFTKDGKFLSNWGTEGSGDGEFNMPWGIDIDSQGNVFIADWRNDRIQKFSADGKFLMKFGSSGSGEGQFNRPTDVAVDKDGVIYVADWMNDRIQVFDTDGSFVTLKTGDATVSKWGRDKLDANAEMWGERDRAEGMERERLFWAPSGITVDDDNNVFICESPRNRIQVYRKQSATFAGPRL